MRAGKGSSDAYIEEWRRETVVIESVEDVAATAKAEADVFENGFTDDQLKVLIRNHGAAE